MAKKVAAQAQGYRNIREIEGIYRELLETDVGIKTGKIIRATRSGTAYRESG